MLSQRLYERLVGNQAFFVTAAAEDVTAVHPDVRGELSREPGLADTGLAAEKYHRLVPVSHAFPGCQQARKLWFPPDKGRALERFHESAAIAPLHKGHHNRASESALLCHGKSQQRCIP